MEGASTYVKVPGERIGAVLGIDGKVKSRIEKSLSVRLRIDSQMGDIKITLMPQSQDPTTLFRAKEVITAIGRGFSPERAFRLIEDGETILDVIDLREIAGRSRSDIKRLKGRVIGKGGKTRRIIEELTEANVSVYGYTISTIGKADEVEIAKGAIQMLIGGSLHGTVYRFLHRKRTELKRKKMQLWETSRRD